MKKIFLALMTYGLCACGTHQTAPIVDIDTLLSNSNTYTTSRTYGVGSTSSVDQGDLGETSGKVQQEFETQKDNTNNMSYYQVKSGDTFYGIARKLNLPVADLKRVNSQVNIEHLEVGQKINLPSHTVSQKVVKPQEKLDQKSTVEHLSSREVQGIRWSSPVPNARPQSSFQKGDLGINLRTNTGANILASANGTVTHVQYVKGLGQVILIRHDKAFVSVYAEDHLKALVSPGDVVKRGEKIGKLKGNTLHFEIRHATKVENPMIYLP